jgi:hypothetical protein
VSRMRFEKRHIAVIANLITWRSLTTLGQVRTGRRGYIASRLEVACIVLWRLAMPCRISDMEPHFHRSAGAISELLYKGLECFYETHSPIIKDIQVVMPHIRSRAQEFSRCISTRSKNAVQKCVGFFGRYACSNR